jgi:hypothetical protein
MRVRPRHCRPPGRRSSNDSAAIDGNHLPHAVRGQRGAAPAMSIEFVRESRLRRRRTSSVRRTAACAAEDFRCPWPCRRRQPGESRSIVFSPPCHVGATRGATPRGHTSNSWRAVRPYFTGLSRSRFKYGGEGGIRTPDRLAPMPHFECGAFDHSATSPGAKKTSDSRRPGSGASSRRGWRGRQVAAAAKFRRTRPNQGANEGWDRRTR